MLIAAAYSRALRVAAKQASERNGQNPSQSASASTKPATQNEPSVAKRQH